MSSVSLQKYRYQDDVTPPVDPSSGHMTHGRSNELSHAHLDGYTNPAALTVRKHKHTETRTHTVWLHFTSHSAVVSPTGSKVDLFIPLRIKEGLMVPPPEGAV